MRKTRSAVKFIVKHTQPYYTITYRRPKLAAVEAVKSCRDGTATGNNTCDQRYILAHSAYAERRGSCKMASFSDVKLKAP